MRCSLPCQAIPRPVAALSDEYPQGFVDTRHRHARAQLLFAASGVMMITTDAGTFVVPPQRALWLPSGVQHEVACRSAVSLRTLYVDDAAIAGLPHQPRVIEVSGLLRALILEAMRMDANYAVEGRDGRIMRLILDEISEEPEIRLFLPMPSSERLLRVCRFVLADLTDGDLDAWASIAGMSRRTMTRMFRDETGVSLGTWRQQARLVTACARLSEGASVAQAACEVGYDSPSAFTALFQRVFGMTPSVHMRRTFSPASTAPAA
jgi:AraC-like DNA-binding protein